MEKRKNIPPTQPEQGDEYSHGMVPLTERKSFMTVLVISLGYVFVVTSMQVGGSIGVALNFQEAFWAILAGSAILSVLACIMGVIATKSGLSFGLLSKYSFGQAGTWVPVVIVAVTTIGWFSIDAYLIGSSAHTLISALPILPVAILGGLGMTLTARNGMRWMSVLSNIAVPVIFVFGVISIVIAVRDCGGAAGMNAMVTTDTMTFAQAVSMGVGSYAEGAVMFTPDIMRFARTVRTSVAVMIITLMIGNSFVAFFGAIGSLATGDPDIMAVLAAQGLLGPAFLAMILNIWSTAQGCVYSGSMTLSSALKMPRKRLVLIFGGLGIVLACIGFYNMFGVYINFLASTVPPLVGVFLADYLFKYRKTYPALEEYSLPKVEWSGFVSWAVGFAVSYVNFALPTINCVVVAFLVKAAFDLAAGKKRAD